jgi:hypothetical protein
MRVSARFRTVVQGGWTRNGIMILEDQPSGVPLDKGPWWIGTALAAPGAQCISVLLSLVAHRGCS